MSRDCCEPRHRSTFRTIKRGTITVPAGQLFVPGPTLRRRPGERISIFVFLLTPATTTTGPIVVQGEEGKLPGQAADEFSPFVRPTVLQPINLTIEWTAVGVRRVRR